MKDFLTRYRFQIIIFSLTLVISLILILLISRPKTPPAPKIEIKPTPSVILSPTETPIATGPAESSNSFNQKWNQLIQNYPWYPYLPIQTLNYSVVYDFDKNSFRIRLLKPDPDGSLLNQALEELQSIGVDLKQFPHYVL